VEPPPAAGLPERRANILDDSFTAATRRQAAAPDPARPRLLQPGRNCWRIERASRLAFLVDGHDYFGAVRAALVKARKSFFILGWDIDSRMRLTPHGANDGYPEPLGEFLNAVVSRRHGLRGYVLTWDYAMLYNRVVLRDRSRLQKAKPSERIDYTLGPALRLVHQ